jgi:hypothetical protein
MSELIRFKKVVISDERLLVVNSHTVFVEKTNLMPADISSILKLRQSIVIKIKELDGVRVKYSSGMKKKLVDSKEPYLTDIAKFRCIFAKLKDGWKQKMMNGIYTGYSDDKEFDRLKKLEWELAPLTYRSTVISKVHGIKYRLEQIQEQLSRYNPRAGYEKIVCL